MTVQRSKQFLVEGYVHSLKEKIEGDSFSTRIIIPLPFYRRASASVYTWVA